MTKKIPAVLITSLILPLLAFGQESQMPTVSPHSACYERGAHMWGSSCGFGWICSLLLLMILVGAVMKFSFYRRCHGMHHRCGHGHGMGQHHGDTCGSWSDPNSSALRILNERFAKGEIQKEEYETKKTAILS